MLRSVLIAFVGMTGLLTAPASAGAATIVRTVHFSASDFSTSVIGVAPLYDKVEGSFDISFDPAVDHYGHDVMNFVSNLPKTYSSDIYFAYNKLFGNIVIGQNPDVGSGYHPYDFPLGFQIVFGIDPVTLMTVDQFTGEPTNFYYYNFVYNASAPSYAHFIGNLTVEMSDAQAAVPEPAGWAMMIVGFVGAGIMLRRRVVVKTAV